MNKIYRTFDLPVKLHESDTDKDHLHDITPKAKTVDEIERRRSLPPGTLCIERLQRGTAAASSLLELVGDDPDDAFITQTLAPAAFNSSWYSLAEGSTDVMRRQLRLPVLQEVGQARYLDRADLVQQASTLLLQASQPVNTLRTRARLNERNTRRTHARIGRMIGNASMLLSAADADVLDSGDAYETSQAVREQAKQTQHNAINLHAAIGRHPSLASLASPYSDMSIYWMRTAPAHIEVLTGKILQYHQMTS